MDSLGWSGEGMKVFVWLFFCWVLVLLLVVVMENDDGERTV